MSMLLEDELIIVDEPVDADLLCESEECERHADWWVIWSCACPGQVCDPCLRTALEPDVFILWECSNHTPRAMDVLVVHAEPIR